MKTMAWPARVVVAAACAGLIARAAAQSTPAAAGATGAPPASPAQVAPVPAQASPAPLLFLAPLPDLTADERARLEAGRKAFETEEGLKDGLGPLFNGPPGAQTLSCAACHGAAGTGGGSTVLETRFGRRAADGTFDPLTAAGGSLLHTSAIPGFAVQTMPPEANVVARRRTIPLFGLGLVDAVPDDTFEALALFEATRTPATAGRVSHAASRADGHPVVAKFGWKAQLPSLLEFSAGAYVNEMGITSPLFPLENCPNAPPGSCDDAVPNPDSDGTDVGQFRDYMTLLAPPPRGEITQAVTNGEATFGAIGCADCHAPALRTGPSPVAALGGKVFHPYSDFLLHDMGALGDGIGGEQPGTSGVEAVARAREMRTQPLWGLRAVERFLHDGRAATPEEAIAAHDGQGAGARDRFLGLSPEARADLVAFLKSL
jgi:CxxC motif-containing protein (DUF1111 family)